ncbi:phosphotransferase [Haliscomenobacter hydrossis]|uniref:Aminoglycoside phosphotransferase n=1 Tax=Haliscomenobacter hydrossis (strain ATCC 27775 / DSM 1100 / LMG 10767 / O) TaxID=760192 RepID=F4L2L8_HALH1|nr:phosphotransferase [Haliscomenobacter hydrossis]AEE53936.1 aminoglycoside phosphotransferase [Haliscomenobacter hydrossis DSM 1100]
MHLDQHQLSAIGSWMTQHDLLAPEETILSAEKAGEGNMNYTLRVKSTLQSVILKQARPYVEKYPSIAAPVERAAMEAAFFSAAAPWEGVEAMLPKLLYFSPEDHLQVIEDLGEGADFSSFYARKEAIPAADLASLLGFLHTLHQQSRKNPPAGNFQNRAMRELNHFHIFDFPFQPGNGLKLDGNQAGLQALAERTIFRYPNLREKTLKLGQRYLADGDTLLHGDFFPGSWLRTSRGVFVIDPEFCFRGEAAFDLGVCLAHLYFCGMDWTEAFSNIRKHYGEFDELACAAFASVEILRRLYGVAQLPLSFSMEEKEIATILAINRLLTH